MAGYDPRTDTGIPTEPVGSFRETRDGVAGNRMAAEKPGIG